jgi:hypothetical protein
MSEKNDLGSAAGAAPIAPVQATPVAAYDLPDDLRVPLHELKADARYLVGRVASDGSTGGMIATAIETKLSHVEEAALRLNGSCVDLLEALKRLTLMARTSGGTAGRDEALCDACDKAECAIAKAEESSADGRDGVEREARNEPTLIPKSRRSTDERSDKTEAVPVLREQRRPSRDRLV